MNVFLSWSGSQSHKVAAALHRALPLIFHSAKPWFSPEDIPKGNAWTRELHAALDESNFAIFCLTRVNLQSAWMLYELGMCSARFETKRVCPLLVDLGKIDIEGPYSTFQMTLPTREDMFKLMQSLNEALTQPLTAAQLSHSFDSVWLALERTLIEAGQETPLSAPEPRDIRKVAEEILHRIRVLENRIGDPEARIQAARRRAYLLKNSDVKLLLQDLNHELLERGRDVGQYQLQIEQLKEHLNGLPTEAEQERIRLLDRIQELSLKQNELASHLDAVRADVRHFALFESGGTPR